MGKFYLRPIGLVHGEQARLLMEDGRAGRLAGGDTAFTFLEVIERRKPGDMSRKIESFESLARRSEPVCRRLLAEISAKRPMISGLDPSRPLIMGIVNVTPDSFSDGGRFLDPETAIRQGRELAAAGADILDIGGESTRPGAEAVAPREEKARILPVVSALAADGHCVSADTRKAAVMKAALESGARIINDVSALSHDQGSFAMLAKSDCPVILMHAQGDPKTMQDDPQYDDVSLDVYDFLEARIARCIEAGIDKSRLIIDPGIGFGKRLHHNLQLIRELSIFHGLGVPILMGASRKSFIGHITGQNEAQKRLAGSLGVAVLAVQQMAQLLRVHDVRETHEIVSVLSNCESQGSSC